MNDVRFLCEAEDSHQKAAAIILDWVNGDQHLDTEWTRLFASAQSVLDKMKPTSPTLLWRNERHGDESQYARFTSWSTVRDIAADYPAGGGRNRQLVSALIEPVDMICFVPAFGPKVDWLHQQEMIVRPGHYDRTPFKGE